MWAGELVLLMTGSAGGPSGKKLRVKAPLWFQGSRGRDRQIPGAHQTPSLAKFVCSRFIERVCLNGKRTVLGNDT